MHQRDFVAFRNLSEALEPRSVFLASSGDHSRLWLSASSVIVMRSGGRFVGVGKVARSGWGGLVDFRGRLRRKKITRIFACLLGKKC